MSTTYLREKWADILAVLSNIIFAVALWPSVVGANKPEALTSAMTIVALTMLTASLIKARLYWGAVAQLGCTSMWFVLLCQVGV